MDRGTMVALLLDNNNYSRSVVTRTNSGDLNRFLFSERRRWGSYRPSKLTGKRSNKPPKSPLNRHRSSKSLSCIILDEDEKSVLSCQSLITPEPQPFVLRHRALVSLQAHIRTHSARNVFVQIKSAIQCLQSRFRGRQVRKRKPYLHLEAHLVRIEDDKKRELREIEKQRRAFFRKEAKKEAKRAKKEEKEQRKGGRELEAAKAEAERLRFENHELRRDNESLRASCLRLAQQQQELIAVQVELAENVATLDEYVKSLEQEVNDMQYIHDTFELKLEQAQQELRDQIEENAVEKQNRILYGMVLDQMIFMAKDYCGGAM